MLIKQLLRFIVVGVVNTSIGYGVIFFCMYALKIDPVASNVVGYAIGLMFSFFLHKKFTFRSDGRASTELMKFLVVFAIAYAMNLLTLYLCLDHWRIHAAVSQIVSGCVYVATSFVLNKLVVFKNQEQS